MRHKLTPFLPSIITIVGMFLMYRKFDPGNEQDPIQKEINKVFKTLDPKSREEMTKVVMEAVGPFSGKLSTPDTKNDRKEVKSMDK